MIHTLWVGHGIAIVRLALLATRLLERGHLGLQLGDLLLVHCNKQWRARNRRGLSLRDRKPPPSHNPTTIEHSVIDESISCLGRAQQRSTAQHAHIALLLPTNAPRVKQTAHLLSSCLCIPSSRACAAVSPGTRSTARQRSGGSPCPCLCAKSGQSNMSGDSLRKFEHTGGSPQTQRCSLRCDACSVPMMKLLITYTLAPMPHILWGRDCDLDTFGGASSSSTMAPTARQCSLREICEPELSQLRSIHSTYRACGHT